MPSNPLSTMLEALLSQAGSRGATFAGRVVKPAVYRPDPNDPRDPIPQDDRKKYDQQIASILARPPQEVPDAEGMGTAMMLATSPAVRTLGSKVFKDAPKAAAAGNPWQEALMDRIAQGQPMRRSSLRPAIKYASGEVAIGSPSTGHGSLWEAVTPAQQKGAIDGYVDAAERFVTRDQGTILSGSLDSIKAALQNTFLER